MVQAINQNYSLFDEKLKPIVSIGMTVYNSEETISEAIGTILNQTYHNFEFLISDNASTDGTEQICRNYAKKDPRITYIRQKKNTGGGNNLIFLYKQAKGEFFMWASAHYSRSLNFIEKNLEVLRENSNCTFASTPNCWVGEEEDSEKVQTFSFEGTAYERVSKYLSLYMQSHACFYGLFRRSAMEGVEKLANNYIALDNAFIVQQLLNGEFRRSSDGLLVVGKGQSAHPDFIGTFQTRPIHYIFPIYDYSKNIIVMLKNSEDISFKEFIILLLKIFVENIKVYRMIVRYRLIRITKKIGIYEFIKKIKK